MSDDLELAVNQSGGDACHLTPPFLTQNASHLNRDPIANVNAAHAHHARANAHIQAPAPAHAHTNAQAAPPHTDIGPPNPAGITRGIRNNNPGTIRLGPAWQGRSAHQTDTAFTQFNTPEYGLRALTRVLHTYQTRHRLNTVEAIISRWAPPADNNPTNAYIDNVARSIGVGRREQVVIGDNQHTRGIIRAIINQENSAGAADVYTDEQISTGIRMALPATWNVLPTTLH